MIRSQEGRTKAQKQLKRLLTVGKQRRRYIEIQENKQKRLIEEADKLAFDLVKFDLTDK